MPDLFQILQPDEDAQLPFTGIWSMEAVAGTGGKRRLGRVDYLGTLFCFVRVANGVNVASWEAYLHPRHDPNTKTHAVSIPPDHPLVVNRGASAGFVFVLNNLGQQHYDNHSRLVVRATPQGGGAVDQKVCRITWKRRPKQRIAALPGPVAPFTVVDISYPTPGATDVPRTFLATGTVGSASAMVSACISNPGASEFLYGFMTSSPPNWEFQFVVDAGWGDNSQDTTLTVTAFDFSSGMEVEQLDFRFAT